MSFAYTLSTVLHLCECRCCLSEDLAMDLFVAADQFGVERLKRLCEKKILTSINVDSVATILQAADQRG